MAQWQNEREKEFFTQPPIETLFQLRKVVHEKLDDTFDLIEETLLRDPKCKGAQTEVVQGITDLTRRLSVTMKADMDIFEMFAANVLFVPEAAGSQEPKPAAQNDFESIDQLLLQIHQRKLVNSALQSKIAETEQKLQGLQKITSTLSAMAPPNEKIGELTTNANEIHRKITAIEANFDTEH